MKINFWKTFCLGISISLFTACDTNYSPKPAGYFRVDLPKHEYITDTSNCGYSFQRPTYSHIMRTDKPCWENLVINPIHGVLHLTYQNLSGNFDTYLEDAQELVYKHTSKADGIKQSAFVDDRKKVYGMVYELLGEPASTVQFYVTDSSQHFLRGALYFNAATNRDSLEPLIAFATEDIKHLVSTIEWAQ